MRVYRWPVCAIGLCVFPLWGAGALHKVWEIRLDKRIAGMESVAGVRPPPIWALGFSPDAKRLAIGLGMYGAPKDPYGHLLVIPVDQPNTALAQFEIKKAGDTRPEPHYEITWSPDGERLALGWGVGEAGGQTFVVNLKKGVECSLADDVFWLDDNRFLVAGEKPVPLDEYERLVRDLRLPKRQPVPGVTFFSLVGPGCTVESQWKMEGKWTALASEPGHIAMRGPKGDFILLDATGQVVHQWPIPLATLLRWTFLENGRAVCGNLVSSLSDKKLAGFNNILACFDAGSGNMIDEEYLDCCTFGPVTSGGGSRIAVSEYHEHITPVWLENRFDLSGGATTFKRRVILDIRSRSEIASWQPRTQHAGIIGEGHARSAFALSPDGKLLAEGDSGSVRLYDVK
jgi:hypothetical protein